MSHEVHETWAEQLGNLVPFGMGQTKPGHFRDMARVVWQNRDNLGYAWKVLSQGVCDGCALGVAGFHDWTISGTHLCMTRLNLLRLNTMPPFDPQILTDVGPLRQQSNTQLRDLGRLAYPMLRKKGEPGFRRIPWETALDLIADRYRSSNPDRAAFFLTSRGITNEVYYVAQKVVRFLGSNHIENAARLCHSPSTAAMKRTLGVAASTCSYVDWIGTDLVVFFGSNPANDQPVSIKYLDLAKRQGTKIALVNPYLEPGMKRYWVPSTPASAVFGTKVADYWFPVSKGGDIAFLQGVLRLLIERGQVDRSFLEAHTTGFETIAAEVIGTDWSTLEAGAGLPKSSFEEFADLLVGAKNAVFVWSMGITQHTCGADAVQMILNLGLARGYVGRDFCGLVPIRGHSGVQGGAEMGAYATALPGGKPLTPENLAALKAEYGFPIPARPGRTATEMVEAAGRGDLDLLYCLGGNFLRTLPDPNSVAAALSRVPLRVHQDILLNDQMLLDPGEAVLLLPAQTRYEQEGGGTETTTERRVCFSPEIPRQVGEAKAEWRILLELAEAIQPGAGQRLGCQTGQAIREEIARVVPFYRGIENLRKSGDAFQYGGRHLCAGGQFPTEDHKARFHPVPLPTIDRQPGEFDLATRRGKQFNSLIYGEVDPLNGTSRDAILISFQDAAALHLTNGDRVTLVSSTGRYLGRLHLAPIAPGNLQVHWPEGNVLIPSGRIDREGGVPDYNTRVRVEIGHTPMEQSHVREATATP